MSTSTDRIEREILIKAPRGKVWRALANAPEFGRWFGAKLEGQTFAAGKRVKGPITYPGYEHLTFDVTVERIEPERHLSFRWHPAPMEPSFDYAQEPTTLVVFELQEAEGGTLLRIVESGFDAIPPARRLEAFRMNSGGWDIQVQNISKHVTAS